METLPYPLLLFISQTCVSNLISEALFLKPMQSLNKDTSVQRNTNGNKILGILPQVIFSSSDVKGSAGYFANVLYTKIDTVFEVTPSQSCTVNSSVQQHFTVIELHSLFLIQTSVSGHWQGFTVLILMGKLHPCNLLVLTKFQSLHFLLC